MFSIHDFKVSAGILGPNTTDFSLGIPGYKYSLSAFRGVQPDHHLNNISLFHLIFHVSVFQIRDATKDDPWSEVPSISGFWIFRAGVKSVLSILELLKYQNFIWDFTQSEDKLFGPGNPALNEVKRLSFNLPNWIQFVQLYSSPKEKSPYNKWCNPND